MVKIRLQRYGAKKRPFYRIVAADSRQRRDGRFIEHIVSYDPISYEGKVNLNEDRIKYWLGKGAIPSQSVENILKKHGLIQAGS